MRFLIFLFLALAAHFLFDLGLQSDEIAKNKKGLNKQMLLHGLMMGVSSGLIIALYFQSLLVFVQASLIIGVTHIAIDAVRVELKRKYLGLDQILHTGVILLVFWYFSI